MGREGSVSKQLNARLTGTATITRWTHRTIVGFSLIALAGVSAAAQTEFTYFGTKGPAAWGQLDPAWAVCGQGHEQSPVNLGKAFSSAELRRQPVPIEYGEAKGQTFNNGHTIETETEGRNVLNLGGVAYELQQFHFHGPSEHTIDGKGTEMELHLVHKSAPGGIAVVGVLLVRGASSGALAPIFAHLPNDIGVKHPLPTQFNLRNFLPAKGDYYRYEGSLTTPPCTEGVHWIVLKDPVTVSGEDLAQFHERIHFNARPVQRLRR